jgi:ATP-dependent helicase Lhr and Lhr-like helicase
MADAASGAFGLLAEPVRRWIYREGWSALRDIQEQAVAPVLAGDADVLISSGTASGKTEAAFIPIASALSDGGGAGVAALCVSPLKALINDQARRLEPLFDTVGRPVHPWHGDVGQKGRREVLAGEGGVLLITPESLEAFFVRRGHQVPHLFDGLRYVVVDEFHAFIGSERGMQLQSLLHRLETAVRRRIPRVALSATLGDLDAACELLRPGGGARVHRVVSDANRSEVQLQVRGYRIALADAPAPAPGDVMDDVTDEGEARMEGDLFRFLRGGRHIVFANRRGDVEQVADALRRRCESMRLPNEFWPHHGSLQKQLREDAEDALRNPSRPATAIATTTLELGIDVGAVESIGQIGPPPSVASMRQRLGRAGRRGSPAVLRIFIRENEIRAESPPQDRLRMHLVQTVAMVRLLAQRWYEPPDAGALHLSTLVQQVLSVLAQHGDATAEQIFRLLCVTGPFRGVDAPTFMALLRDLGGADLVTQVHTGSLMLGGAGERLVNQYDFYAAFTSPEEYRLEAGTRTLGTLPVTIPVTVGVPLVFAGRRWKVTDVDDERKVIYLAPSGGGRPPAFGGSAAQVHGRVRSEMRAVYMAGDMPAFLDPQAVSLLEEARAAFRRLELRVRALVPWDRGTLWFPWVGDRALGTLQLMLRGAGLDAVAESGALRLAGCAPDEVEPVLRDLAAEDPPDPRTLAESVATKHVEKHHVWLSDALLAADYAAGRLDVAGAREALRMHPAR